MRTIQMTLNDNSVTSVDRVVKKLNTTRSAFTREALKDAIKQVNLNMLGSAQGSNLNNSIFYFLSYLAIEI